MFHAQGTREESADCRLLVTLRRGFYGRNEVGGSRNLDPPAGVGLKRVTQCELHQASSPGLTQRSLCTSHISKPYGHAGKNKRVCS
jgi:hypothetical protein